MSTALSAEPPSLSALSKYLAKHTPPSSKIDPGTYSLALHVQHQLQYQHEWTELSIVTHSPLTQELLRRPLITGLPPKRIYVHPDDQVEEVKRRVKEEDVEVEREWVLPARLKEKWSLKSFAEVFDAVGEEPPIAAAGEKDWEEERGRVDMEKKGRRGGKRVLLATLGEDSTVVYYIMHDGVVKPRQN